MPINNIDPYRQFLNYEKISWTKPLQILLFGCFLVLVVALISFFGLINLYQSSVFVMTTWNKFLFWFLSIYLFGGFGMLIVKGTEWWDESLIDIQNGKYFTSAKHLRQTVELILPDNPQNIDYSSLFVALNSAFRTTNATKENDMNMGKKSLSLFFDFVADNGQIRVYATLATSKIAPLEDAFRRFAPQIQLAKCEVDPVAWLKKDFKSGKLDLDAVSGFGLSLTKSNMYPLGSMIDNDPKPQKSLQDLLKTIKSASQDKIIILQYGFIFTDSWAQKKYQGEFDKYIQNLTNQYNAPINGKPKSVADLFPTSTMTEYNAIYKRLNSIWFMGAIRTLCYNKINHSQKTIEDIFRPFAEGSKLPIAINYLTSTNQTYYKFTKLNRQPEADEIYNVYVYPEEYMENIMAPLYEKYYYPQESKLRRMTIVRSIFVRNPMQPWHTKFTFLDTSSIHNYFSLDKV